jgi:hypothetical protein
VALCLQLSACGGEGGSAAALEAAVQRSMSLMNEADWETAYREVLTNGQRAACSVEEYAESEGEGLEALRETVGAGELGVIELNTDVVGNVGLVTGTIIYTARLGEQLETKGQGFGRRPGGEEKPGDRDRRKPGLLGLRGRCVALGAETPRFAL